MSPRRVALLLAVGTWANAAISQTPPTPIPAKREPASILRPAQVPIGSNDLPFSDILAKGRPIGFGVELLPSEPGELPPHYRTLTDLVHPDDSPRLRGLIDDLLARRIEQFSHECRLRTKAGEWRWILDRGKMVARHPAGRALRVTGTHTDITAARGALQVESTPGQGSTFRIFLPVSTGAPLV